MKAARRILAFGPRAVVVKRGEYGALFFSGEEVFAASAVPLASVFDPTGAGDSFAGGFMGYLARSRPATITPRCGARSCSAACSRASRSSGSRSTGSATLAPEEIRARYAEARRLAHFDDLEAGSVQRRLTAG